MAMQVSRDLVRNDHVAETPLGAKIELMSHQRTLLHRCLELEQGYPIFVADTGTLTTRVGVIADPPRTGRTFIVLALALQTLAPRTMRTLMLSNALVELRVHLSPATPVPASVFVVPVVTVAKWRACVAAFLPPDVNVLWVTARHHVTDACANVFSHRLVIVTSVQYARFAANTRSLCFDRVVFDDAELLSPLFGPALTSRFTWFVSPLESFLSPAQRPRCCIHGMLAGVAATLPRGHLQLSSLVIRNDPLFVAESLAEAHRGPLPEAEPPPEVVDVRCRAAPDAAELARAVRERGVRALAALLPRCNARAHSVPTLQRQLRRRDPDGACCICLNPVGDRVRLICCLTSFCAPCIARWLEPGGRACPMCNARADPSSSWLPEADAAELRPEWEPGGRKRESPSLTRLQVLEMVIEHRLGDVIVICARDDVPRVRILFLLNNVPCHAQRLPGMHRGAHTLASARDLKYVTELVAFSGDVDAGAVSVYDLMKLFKSDSSNLRVWKLLEASFGQMNSEILC